MTNTNLKIKDLVRIIPGNQEIEIYSNTEKEVYQTGTASMFCEMIRNNRCVGFDGNWQAYHVAIVENKMRIQIEPYIE